MILGHRGEHPAEDVSEQVEGVDHGQTAEQLSSLGHPLPALHPEDDHGQGVAHQPEQQQGRQEVHVHNPHEGRVGGRTLHGALRGSQGGVVGRQRGLPGRVSQVKGGHLVGLLVVLVITTGPQIC